MLEVFTPLYKALFYIVSDTYQLISIYCVQMMYTFVDIF